MPKRHVVVVHYLHVDGKILCRGLDVADAGRLLEDDPYRVAFAIADATCEVCKLAHARIVVTEMAS